MARGRDLLRSSDSCRYLPRLVQAFEPWRDRAMASHFVRRRVWYEVDVLQLAIPYLRGMRYAICDIRGAVGAVRCSGRCLNLLCTCWGRANAFGLAMRRQTRHDIQVPSAHCTNDAVVLDVADEMRSVTSNPQRSR